MDAGRLPTTSQPAAGKGEQLIVVLVVALLAPLAAFAIAGPYYFARPFWSDEVLSWLIATDPDFDHGMAALAGGVDTNAPLLHLLFRLLAATFGSSPVVFRVAAWIAMAVAFTGLYLTLRRSVKASAATFGCLCFAVLPIVITHATEARFYAFELAAAVWTNLFLLRRGDAGLRSYAARIALSSVALCGFHYFGVIALFCIVLSHAFLERSAMIAWLVRVWPTVAGFAMTATLLPLIIAQRTAMRDAGGTWVQDDLTTNLRVTIETLLPARSLLIAVGVALISVFVYGKSAIVDALREQRGMLIASAGYVVCMLALDRLMQPVFVPRYFIVALPAVAAIATAFASRWPTAITRVAIAAMVITLCVQWSQVRQRSNVPNGRTAAGLLASVEHVDRETPIFSDWLGHALPIVQSRPELRDRVSYFADRRLRDATFDSAIRYEREMAACVQRFYDVPGRATLAGLDRLNRFVLLTEYPETIAERFPGYDARPLGTVAAELTRKGVQSAKADASFD